MKGSAQSSSKSCCGQPQCFVDQRPAYDNQVISRKSGIIRPDKRKKKRKYL